MSNHAGLSSPASFLPEVRLTLPGHSRLLLMTTLENDYLRVAIRPQGAQLASLFHKPSGIEHLWQADPSVWPWHAPNLFPIVGGLSNDQVLIDGKEYSMKRHGFARLSTFVTVESSTNHAVFSLRANDETRALYPYDFDFQLIYELSESSLSITYRVVNEGDRTMYFSVGAHPAFNAPFVPDETYEDYFLEFDRAEPLTTHQLSAAGLFNGETKPVPTESNQLMLTPHLFDEDALVFKDLTSRSVSLKSKKNDHAVTVSFPAFPYLGVWAKPGAPFVCIEPWLGCADSEGGPKPIEQKEAIQQVAADDVFAATFTITIR